MIIPGASLPDLIGYVGVGLILSTYFLLQLGRLTQDRALYSLLNGLGAVGILISLWFEPNWPAIVVEVAWLLISLFGLARVFSKRS